MKRVVVLTDYSLLAQGIASRLRQSSRSLQVDVVDFRQPNVLDSLVQLQPQVVIFESRDVEKSNMCSLSSLFNALPNLVVIELNLDNSNIHLIRGGQYNAIDCTDLLRVLDDASGHFPEILAAI
jgi:DNA-binding NarL/FixJ family response regulator